MSVASNNITAISIGVANVGTAITGDNSTKIASGNFFVNTWDSFQFVIQNTASYAITGIKTFINGLQLNGGTNALTPITIGASRASIVELKQVNATTHLLLLMGQTQFLSPNIGTGGTNVFKNPIVVKDINNRIINGSVSATAGGTIVTFSNAFTTVPLVFMTLSATTTPSNVGVFDVTASSFKAYSPGTATASWFAIGS